MVPKTRASQASVLIGQSSEEKYGDSLASPLGAEGAPAMGKICLPRSHIKHLTQSLATLAQSTGDTLQNLQVSLDSLAKVVLDNQLLLDFLLAEQGGVCAVINKTCCTYICTPDQVETLKTFMTKPSSYTNSLKEAQRSILRQV